MIKSLHGGNFGGAGVVPRYNENARYPVATDLQCVRGVSLPVINTGNIVFVSPNSIRIDHNNRICVEPEKFLFQSKQKKYKIYRGRGRDYIDYLTFKYDVELGGQNIIRSRFEITKK